MYYTGLYAMRDALAHTSKITNNNNNLSLPSNKNRFFLFLSLQPFIRPARTPVRLHPVCDKLCFSLILLCILKHIGGIFFFFHLNYIYFKYPSVFFCSLFNQIDKQSFETNPCRHKKCIWVLLMTK
uniref:Uncharacterized protein n=1 Tax=Daphnia magna TaxID=35525 RepID=A0A0P4Y527_9CRUS